MCFVRRLILLFSLLYLNCDAEKYCRYNTTQPYPYHLFILFAGYGCYLNANPLWLVSPKGLAFKGVAVEYENIKYPMPIVYINGTEDETDFNYTDEDSMKLLRTLYSKPEYFEKKWKVCAMLADDCCANHLNDENSIPTPEYPCQAIWDGFNCFPHAKANTTVYAPCPPYTSTSDNAVCQLSSERYCLSDKWNPKSNYLPCASSIVYRRRHNFHVAILSVAVAFMMPSIIIYFSFDKLRKAKSIIFHRNLIVSILIKNILVIISKEVVILDSIRIPSNNVMLNDGMGCRFLSFIESASKNAIFTCMSIDAFFLHKIFVRPFSGGINMMAVYIIIIAASFTPTTIWAILMAVYDIGHCWMADGESWLQWISDGYKYIMLGINVLLLLDILRVLFMKLNKNDNKQQTRAAFKATLVLLPLFGIPLLITGQREIVDMNDCYAGDIYMYTTYTIEAAQGILLCILFCYFNSDVHGEFKKIVRKLKIFTSEHFGFPSQVHTKRRRTTATTIADGPL